VRRELEWKRRDRNNLFAYSSRIEMGSRSWSIIRLMEERELRRRRGEWKWETVDIDKTTVPLFPSIDLSTWLRQWSVARVIRCYFMRHDFSHAMFHPTPLFVLYFETLLQHYVCVHKLFHAIFPLDFRYLWNFQFQISKENWIVLFSNREESAENAGENFYLTFLFNFIFQFIS